jgi:polysaccharide deacetylase family protein (PEP-CTERM system associated)
MQDRQVALVGIDFEDWRQLALRQAGVVAWDRPNDAFVRQVHALLDLLDEVHGTATFFILGVTAKNYPGLVEEVIARGHEPASHGFAHVRAFEQTPAEFRSDIEKSIRQIVELTGRAPVGFRAPVFSVNRDTVWVYSILAELGFRWDSSQYDSPRVPRRLRGIPATPYALVAPDGARLLEIPLAVRRFGRVSVPIAGGSYWRILPSGLIRRVLPQSAGDPAVLYFHPHEFDAEVLHPALPPGSSLRQRAVGGYKYIRANPGRHRLRSCLRRVARDYRLTSYERELAEVERHHGERTRTLSEDGLIV